MSITTRAPGRTTGRHWRTVDIVVTAVIAVACGVVFWGWSLLANALNPVFIGFPPAGGTIVGVWLLAGPLAGLIVRKPGAALFAETVAGTVEALLGNQWGLSNIWYGLGQGIGAELAFLVFAYRRWGLPTALLSAALTGVASALMDLVFYYPTWAAGWKIGYLVIVVLSALVVAGFGSHYLVRALARTGVLAPFASGRSVRQT